MKLKQVFKKSNVLATVISLVERSETRLETVESLKAFGLEPLVIESDPRDNARNHGNYNSNLLASLEAIQAALDAKANLLFCEDDIYFSKHFGVYVNWAAEKDEIVYFYAHDKTDRLTDLYGGLKPSIAAREQREPELRAFVRTSWLAFTQCVYIPYKYLAEFDLEAIKAYDASFDIWLMNWITNRKQTAYVALPHPVQHKNVRLGKENETITGWKRSLSFVETDRYVPEIRDDSPEITDSDA
jgi:hypothetical protein